MKPWTGCIGVRGEGRVWSGVLWGRVGQAE